MADIATIATESPKTRFAEIEVTRAGAIIRTLADAWTIAQTVRAAGLAPRGLDTPQKIMVALMAGAEAGLPPMATLKMTMIINNTPTLFGDGPIALVLRSGTLAAQRDGVEGDGDDRFAWYECERKGVETVTRREFSVRDAKVAKLWNKQGPKGPTPWVTHPDRMLLVRARAFALRDLFGDILSGFSIAEEVIEHAGNGGRAEIAPTGSAGFLQALTARPVDEAVDDPSGAPDDAVWEAVAAEVEARDATLPHDPPPSGGEDE